MLHSAHQHAANPKRLSSYWRNPTVAMLVGVGLVLLLGARELRGLMLLNRGNIYAMRAALVGRSNVPRAEGALKQAAVNGQAQANWTLGYLGRWQQDEQARRQAQAALILNAPDRLYMLSNLQPNDEALAQFAISHYPDRPQAIAWRAYQLRQSDPERAVDLYQRALDLDSNPYDWWFGLGRAYENLEDYDAALAAYNVACRKTIGILPCHEKRLLLRKMQAQ